LNPTEPSTSVSPATPEQSAVRNPQSAFERLRAYRLLLVLALVILGLDQLTKGWIASQLTFPTYPGAPGAIPVIRGFFYLIHVGNTGAAWSMFAGQSVLLAGLAAGTLVAIWWWRHSLGLRARLPQICFGLLCGGIAGNLIDRLRYGHVVDFIDLHFGSYIYPTFNVADSGICIGVILYLWHSLRAPKP
jgi:signal peptidase II